MERLYTQIHTFIQQCQLSVIIYAVAIAISFINTWIPCALYVLVAAMWFIPDRRIEKTLIQ